MFCPIIVCFLRLFETFSNNNFFPYIMFASSIISFFHWKKMYEEWAEFLFEIETNPPLEVDVQGC